MALKIEPGAPGWQQRHIELYNDYQALEAAGWTDRLAGQLGDGVGDSAEGGGADGLAGGLELEFCVEPARPLRTAPEGFSPDLCPMAFQSSGTGAVERRIVSDYGTIVTPWTGKD